MFLARQYRVSGTHAAVGITGPADLRVAIAADRTAVPVGSTIEWKIRADDANLAAAVNAWVDVTLPRGVALIAARADRGPGCTVRAQDVVHCNLDWLSADAPVGNIVLLTRMELEGTARLTVTAGADGGDAVPGDNTTTASASVGPLASRLPLTPPVARLHVALVPDSVSCTQAPDGFVTLGATLAVSGQAKLRVVIRDRHTGERVWILGGSSLGETGISNRATSLATEISSASSVRLGAHVSRPSGTRACSLVVRVAARGPSGRTRLRFPLRTTTSSTEPLVRK
jgi:hypothetical protein